MNSRGLQPAIVALLISAMPGPYEVMAQPANIEASRLTEIIVNGSYRAKEEHPFTFTDLPRDDYNGRIFGQEPSFIFGRTPSVTFYSDSGSYQGYSYFRLRGIDQTRINFTLDGVPLNEPEDQGVYFSNYPDLLNSVSRTQLVRGVGLSQNGTANYAGSVSFDSYDLTRPGSKEVGAGGGSFGSARTYAQYSTKSSINTPAVYLRAAQLHSDGYRRRSGNDSQSLFYKVGTHDPNDQWFVSGFLGHQANQLAWLGATKEQIDRDPRYNANTNEDDRFVQSLTQIQNVRTDSFGNTLTSSIYYNRLSGNYDFDLNNFLGLPSNKELYNYDFASNFLGTYSNYRIDLAASKITLGAHVNSYERQHIGTEATLGRLYRNNGRKDEASVFSRLEHSLGDFTLLGDVQGRYTEFRYIGDQEIPPTHWTFLNPKGGVTYAASDLTDVYYSVGRTGREPTRNDILAGNDNAMADADGALLLGPTSAEHVVDHELGVRTHGREFHVKANVFYMNFDQEIVLNGKVGPNGLPLTESVNSSYRTGLEVEHEYTFRPGVAVFGNGTYNYARMSAQGEDFAPVITPRWTLNQGIEYTKNRLKTRVDVRYQSSSFVDFSNTTKLQSYMTTDLLCGYSFEDVDLNISLNNIFSERYFTNGYIDYSGDARYFIQAPRNIFVSVTWKL
jgi:iron complex outermembrane receptor protein